jgi:hypothetical protein
VKTITNTREPTLEGRPEAFDPENPRHYRWSELALTLPKHIGDDVFWSNVNYRSHSVETERYLKEHGIVGVLYP